MISGTDSLLADIFQYQEHTVEIDNTKSSKHKTSLAGGFKASLVDLAKRLGGCEPHFIRCLKPNSQQKPVVWDHDLVQRQLLYSGVLETVKIRKKGYSYRLPFNDFVNRHKVLAYNMSDTPPGTQDSSQKILQAAGITDYRMGSTKVFLKYYHVSGRRVGLNSPSV